MEVDEDTLHITDCHSSNGNISGSTEVIKTIDVTNYPVRKSRHSTVYDKNLCKDNKPLTDFINKCIFLEPTTGMETIINKVLLPAYVRADTDYKQSERFRKVITKAFERLTNNPGRKYTHISDVVETLKIHVASVPKPTPPVKKRVNFITLSTKVSVKTHENCRKRPILDNTEISPKKPYLEAPEVIALDCDDEVIPIDEEANKSGSNQVGEVDQKNGVAKDNLVNDDTIEIQDSQEVKLIDGAVSENEENEHSTNESNDGETAIKHDNQENNEPTSNEHEKENLGTNENLCDENKLLVPHKEKNVRLEKTKLKKKEPAKTPEEMSEIEKASRIKIIEAKIEKCNKAIAKLDLEEVTDDSANSPYHKCDRLRATIVKLYKELCILVGEEVPERRKIRFQIKEGVPQGPIKRLEKFLNKQADEEGETPFPDFSDVIRCVEKANEQDGLGWSKAKVMKEAQALFTYCGRALQKRRQQREWKHLRALAKAEEFEADPAEQDRELQARLEANRKVARQREAEVFSKFTHMENVPETVPEESTSFQIEPAEHEDSASEETELTQNPIETTVLKENNNNDSINNDNIGDTDAVVIKSEPEEVPIKIQYQGDISLVIEISDSESDDEYGVLKF